jgi:hypothetical protein
MMKTLKQLLFTAALIVAVSISALAQKDGDKKTPPKDKTPVIPVTPKEKPKEDKPKGDKKPGAIIFGNKDETSFV